MDPAELLDYVTVAQKARVLASLIDRLPPGHALIRMNLDELRIALAQIESKRTPT